MPKVLRNGTLDRASRVRRTRNHPVVFQLQGERKGASISPMDGSKRPGSVAFLLVGLVLLVTAAGISGLLPVAPCPACSTAIRRLSLLAQRDDEEQKANRLGKTVYASPVCMRCMDTRKVTLLTRAAFVLRDQ